MTTGINEELISVREAAKECQRNMETVRRWIWAGKLPAQKLGNQLFIKKSDLETFLKNLSANRRETAGRFTFIERATALRERIRAKTGMEFDISALIEESRQRRIS